MSSIGVTVNFVLPCTPQTRYLFSEERSDGSNLVRLTETNEAYNAREIGKDTFIPEQNGHPSWSPDGQKIVFWSNRTGHKQIWVMNADGTNLYSLSNTSYDDWNPVWFKYTDPAWRP